VQPYQRKRMADLISIAQDELYEGAPRDHLAEWVLVNLKSLVVCSKEIYRRMSSFPLNAESLATTIILRFVVTRGNPETIPLPIFVVDQLKSDHVDLGAEDLFDALIDWIEGQLSQAAWVIYRDDVQRGLGNFYRANMERMDASFILRAEGLRVPEERTASSLF